MDVFYATTQATQQGLVAEERLFVIRDCNRNSAAATFRSFRDVARLMWRVRPDMVVSTGAAPGLFALLCARMIGARAIWIDSVANSERLSMSGWLAGFVAHQHFTQWPHLSRPKGPRFIGSLL